MATSPQVLPDQSLAWPIIWDAVVLIAVREGLRFQAYQCQAGVWTYMWGETDGVREGMTCTKAEADQRLLSELTRYSDSVKVMCTRTPNPYQLGALVSLAYNLGLRDDKKKAGLYYTSVLRLHNAGDFAGAARAFAMLNHYRDPTSGELLVSNGLTIRRQQESGLYMTPDPNLVGSDNIDMPQEVAPEKPMVKSQIANSGLIGGAASAITVVTAAVNGQGTVTGQTTANLPCQVSLSSVSSTISSMQGVADKAKTVVTSVKGTVEQAGSTVTSVKESYGTVSTGVHGMQAFLASYDLNVPEVFGMIALIAAAVAFWYRHKQRHEGIV